MYILDTDHLSVSDRGGVGAQRLFQRLASVDPDRVVTTIISYEEQMRGWLAYAARAETIGQQVEAYQQLKSQLMNYCVIPILEFDTNAGQEFQRIRKLYPRLGVMDLKIAAIALVNQAVVLTRNQRDFGQIVGLSIEDWT
ncbi:type II toxin-antitoxin system VapC family toxin [Pseudanabaenaceae cyanobacterium LEGE 13415]|nr:type II toxin-antitoxin system VapC family toxin [Pseudanabaenaceae cyanobacterium LEGE 13415]